MILSLLANPLARYVSGAVAALVVFGVWLTTRDIKQQAIGAEKVLVASKKEGAKANAKNEAVRADAERPGAADRVRKLYCRDC